MVKGAGVTISLPICFIGKAAGVSVDTTVVLRELVAGHRVRGGSSMFASNNPRLLLIRCACR